tara:strand:- start:1198 stop:1851 length:654 start_codon:yes stop_codon:yes gene_type:complete
MSYKQKSPTFFKSALKQYMATHGETGETKIFNTKEEYKNFSNDPSGVGWTKHAKGLAAVELAEDNYNKSKTQGNLNILNRNITSLSPEDRKTYDAKKKSPFEATSGFGIILSGAGEEGTHKYTSGSRSYRGSWDVDFTESAFHPKKDDVVDDSNNNNKNTENNKKSNSSSNIQWPRLFKKNTSKRKRDYNLTACPAFATGPQLEGPMSRRKKRRWPF